MNNDAPASASDLAKVIGVEFARTTAIVIVGHAVAFGLIAAADRIVKKVQKHNVEKPADNKN